METIVSLSCYEGGKRTFIEKSKFEGKLIEDAMKIKNMQFGFLLLPIDAGGDGGHDGHDGDDDKFSKFSLGVIAQTPSRSKPLSRIERKDFLIEKTENIGMLPFIAQLPIARGGGEGKLKTVKDFETEKGLPYDILKIGKSLSYVEASNYDGRGKEVREIEVADWHDNEYIIDEEGNELLPIQCTTTSIIHLPVVTDEYWKKFCLVLSKSYSAQKENIINHLTVDRPESFDPEVLAIILNPRNVSILNLFNALRNEVNNPKNGALHSILDLRNDVIHQLLQLGSTVSSDVWFRSWS